MPPRKILVRAPQWLGDAVVSTVFLTFLKKLEPQSEITVACPPSLTPLFETHPAVTHVHPLSHTLPRNQFDVAYILPRSFRTAWEAWRAGIPKRIGFAGDCRRFLLTDVIAYDPNLLYPHRTLKLIGLEKAPAEQLKPWFPSRHSGESRYDEHPVLGIAPASIAPSRTWEAERFADVANQFLKRNGGTVVLFGSAQERDKTAFIASRIQGHVIDTAGTLNLPDLGSMISQCNLFLCNDSGLMHVASAFEIPTVVLFGASDPIYAVPPVGRFIALQHPEIACVPCLRNHCVRLGQAHNECLKVLSVEEVTQALQTLLKTP